MTAILSGFRSLIVLPTTPAPTVISTASRIVSWLLSHGTRLGQGRSAPQLEVITTCVVARPPTSNMMADVVKRLIVASAEINCLVSASPVPSLRSHNRRNLINEEEKPTIGASVIRASDSII